MITSLFKKSTPINLFLLGCLVVIFLLIAVFRDNSWSSSTISIIKSIGSLTIILSSIFLTYFTAKKNGLSKDSTYTIFFFLLFLMFIPSAFNNINLLTANFFVLLSLRRLLSLRSLKATKEKIFDASFWIICASLFQFWSVLFLIVVFVSVFFYVSRDYRNWIIPSIALFAVAVVSIAISLIFGIDFIGYFSTNTSTNFAIDYFNNIYQNISFSIFATITLFFLVSMMFSIGAKPVVLHSSFKIILITLFLAALIFGLSTNKSNDLLVFTIAPLSIIATSHIEEKQVQLRQEFVLSVLIVCSLFTFFSQL